MKGAALVGLLVAVLLAGAAGGYLIGGNSAQNRTSTTTLTETSVATSSATTTTSVTTFLADQGWRLQLRIVLNATRIGPESAIGAQVILSNPLDSNLTAVMPESNNSTILNWSWDDFLCGDGILSSVVSFALFQGHFVAENLSQAGDPLSLAPPVRPPCGVIGPPQFLVFLPSGSNVWVYLAIPPPPPFTWKTVVNATTELCPITGSGFTCGPSSGLFGYWLGGVNGPMGNYTTSNPDFHYFPPGQYTLAAEDAWGHQAFAYFVVT